VRHRIEVISGEEEGRLAYLAATSGLPANRGLFADFSRPAHQVRPNLRRMRYVPLQRLSARRAQLPIGARGAQRKRAWIVPEIRSTFASGGPERPGAIATGPGSLGRVDSTGVSSSSLSRKAGGVRCP
jgi:hypothetical protein